MVFSGYKDLEVRDKSRIKKAVKDAFYNDTELNSMIDFRYQTQFLPSKDPSKIIADKNGFKEVFFNSMFDGYDDAFAYYKAQNRSNPKFAPQGSTFGSTTTTKLKTEADSSISSNVSINANKKNYANNVFKADDQLSQIVTSYDNRVNLFFSNESRLKEIWTSVYPEKTATEEKIGSDYDSFMVDIAQGILTSNDFSDVNDVEFDEINKQFVKNSPYVQTKMMEGIANGSIDLKEYGFTDSIAREMKNKAKSEMNHLKEIEQVLEDQVAELVRVGLIKDGEYYNLKGFRKDLQQSLQSLNENQIAEQMAAKFGYNHREKEELKLRLRTFKIDSLDKLEQDKVIDPKTITAFKEIRSRQEGFLGEPQEEAFLRKAVGGKFFGYTDEQFDKAYEMSQRVNTVLNNPANKKHLNSKLKAKARRIAGSMTAIKSTPTLNVTAPTEEVRDQNGELIKVKEGQINVVNLIQGELNKLKSSIFSQNVSEIIKDEDTGEYKQSPLSTLVDKEVKRLAKERGYSGKERADFITKETETQRKKLIENALLVQELNENGNYQLLLDGKYVLPISKDGTDINLDKYIPANVKTKFKVNSWVSAAKSSMATNYPLTEGGYEKFHIRMSSDEKPQLVHIGDKNERTLYSSDDWEIMKGALADLEDYERLKGTNKIELEDGTKLSKDEYLKRVLDKKPTKLKKD